MGADLRLGRIAGIELSASWSLLVIVALITWTLGGVVLPQAAPDASAAACWALGIVGAVAFFACLVAHEVAHSLVARAHGMSVEGITLWMFGGVSRLGAEPPDASTELRMALAGPLASAALGVIFLATAIALAVAGVPDVVVAVASWLGTVNLLLAVFNLLPAFPLDGGRVLRAALWRRTDDLRRATTVATRWGVAVGHGLVMVGVVLALSGLGISGLWLALIGWIVLNAARAEQAGAELRRGLAGVTVDDVMTPDPVTVTADLSVDALVRHYVTCYRCSAFPVMGPGGELAGLVTLSRLRDVPAERRATTLVGEVAVPLAGVVTATPDEALVSLVQRLTPASGRRALVVDAAGTLVGIVTARDLDRAFEIADVAGARALTRSGVG
jgi:Zn-dependent protease/predicted transcriptional regulator